jgi:hypothetical protein
MSETGRYYITDIETGRKFCVEPIDNGGNQRLWGDVDPATKKLTGSYGDKHRGAIDEEDSIITEENGFTNIGHAKNPMDYIEKLLKGSLAETD